MDPVGLPALLFTPLSWVPSHHSSQGSGHLTGQGCLEGAQEPMILAELLHSLGKKLSPKLGCDPLIAA